MTFQGKPQNDEDINAMVGVESNKQLGLPSYFSDSEESGHTKVDLSQSSNNGNVEGDSVVAMESAEPMSESKGPLTDLSHLEEDDEEYHPENAVGTEEASPKTDLETSQMLLDFESSVDGQGVLVLTINYVDYPAPCKSSGGRRKPALRGGVSLPGKFSKISIQQAE